MNSETQEKQSVAENFKSGCFAVLGFTEISVNGKRVTMLYIDQTGRERELNQLRSKQLRFDGDTEVLSLWRACLDPDASNNSFVRLDCRFRPFEAKLNLLFTLPGSIPALQSIQRTENIGIVAVPQSKIISLPVQPTQQNFAAAFECPRYDGLDSWLLSYGLAYVMAGLIGRTA